MAKDDRKAGPTPKAGPAAAPAANQMWGGRFASGPAAIMEEINASVGFDKKLSSQDIRGSKAHAAMLAAQGIISKDDAAKIIAGLDDVLAEIKAGKFKWSRQLEDVHMNVESRLKELIGEPAGRLHTARSRNDRWRPTSSSTCATGSTASRPGSSGSSLLLRAKPRRTPPP